MGPLYQAHLNAGTGAMFQTPPRLSRNESAEGALLISVHAPKCATTTGVVKMGIKVETPTPTTEASVAEADEGEK